jgi:signal transduction histidine kinase
MLRTNSLAFRLVAIAAGWSVLGLIVGGFLLSSVFRGSIERSLDNRLMADLENVVSVAEIDCSGSFTMPKPLIAERFVRAFSGSYYQVRAMDPAGGPVSVPLSRSRSLWDKTLAPTEIDKPGQIQKGYAPGPLNQRLRFVERIVSIPGPETAAATSDCIRDAPFRFTVAGDMRDVESEIETFNAILFWSVMGLGLGLVAAMAVFVRLGLSPLEQLSKSLADIRAGRADHLEGRFPVEIQPLADELNALVRHNAEVVARARTHVGNLAHFLKTPLSVLANEVQGVAGPMAETIARQVQVMRRQVDHYLTRARTVASAAVIGARTEVAPVVSDLVRALSKIYASQGISIDKSCPEALMFRGDRSDLEEMIGNLVDNACKWAAREVTVTVSMSAPTRLRIIVEDDGPGLSDEQKARVLDRGERLDESKPGSGLGLGIVKEISALYGGTLTLGRSGETGGLLATLDLPAVDRGA